MYLTFEKFSNFIEKYNRINPNDSHWNINRWSYHSIGVDILKNNNAKNILEIGTMGIKLCESSDEMDFDVNSGWRIQEPKYIHDARNTPWPIPNKKYDFVVALRVFHHLTPYQSLAFQEARRVAENIIIVAPNSYHQTKINSRGINTSDVLDWNQGRSPTEIYDSGHGILYFWNKDALKYI